MKHDEITAWIKEKASALGFANCGISKAEPLYQEAIDLENWLTKNYHGEMRYMENHFDLRIDPTKLVPGAKSVISLSHNYYNHPAQNHKSDTKIAQYAYGNDYHKVLRKKLKTLLQELQKTYGAITGRVFVDSGPVMEKSWAQRSGLGWQGKNTNLITKQVGSYYFLAEIILDIGLLYDSTDHKSYCGSCTKCIDACPTNALTAYKLDAKKCISYLTIELKDSIPTNYTNHLSNWLFGCDICQQVCPWNRFATQHNEEQFLPKKELLNLSKKEWLEITDEVFEELTKKSPLKRAGIKKIKSTLLSNF